MPTEIDGKTYYTPAEVEAGFLPRETVRKDFMPRAEFERRGQRLEAQVLDLTAKVEASKGLADENARLKAEVTRTLDETAYRSAGLLDDSGNIDTGRADFLRMAHRHHIASMEEGKRPADTDADFRQWLTSPEGARSHDYTRHLFPAASTPLASAAPAPAPDAAASTAAPAGQPADMASVIAAAVAQAMGSAAPQPGAKPAPGIPTTGGGVGQPSNTGTLTAADVGREAKSIAASAKTAEGRRAARERLAQMRQQLQTQR